MPVTERVSPDSALERVRTAIGSLTGEVRLNFGHVDITCPPDKVRDIVTTLQRTEGIKCDFFSFLSAVDRSEFGGGEGDKAGGLEVLIHLYSPENVIHVTIHVPVDGEAPICPSISDLFLGALWHERECHEMFGIDFEGHPRLVNLYLPEDFDGHPGRREFKLPSRVVKEWPGAKDPEEAAAGGR